MVFSIFIQFNRLFCNQTVETLVSDAAFLFVLLPGYQTLRSYLSFYLGIRRCVLICPSTWVSDAAFLFVLLPGYQTLRSYLSFYLGIRRCVLICPSTWVSDAAFLFVLLPGYQTLRSYLSIFSFFFLQTTFVKALIPMSALTNVSLDKSTCG